MSDKKEKKIFSHNLQRLMEKTGKSRSDVANDTGIKYATLSEWINQRKYPRIDKIEILAQYFHVKKSDLIEKQETLDIFSIPGIEPMPDTVKVPLLGTIACGEPILADENIEEYISVSQYIKADFCLRCKGDSMINARIHDGDIVCIKQQPTVENGEIAAVLIDDEATLKRFYQYGDVVILRAENPNFRDLEYFNEKLNEIRILGKATHFISKVK